MTRTPLAAVAVAWLAAGCAGHSSAEPAAPSLGQDACRQCRMVISSTRTAAQLAAAYEEPVFFDDVGCLREYLAEHPDQAAARVAYVADHRTGRWVRARDAVYVRAAAVDTPMGSHLLAFETGASRDADDSARGAEPVEARRLFGPKASAGDFHD